jgi:hypothetical protein
LFPVLSNGESLGNASDLLRAASFITYHDSNAPSTGSGPLSSRQQSMNCVKLKRDHWTSNPLAVVKSGDLDKGGGSDYTDILMPRATGLRSQNSMHLHPASSSGAPLTPSRHHSTQTTYAMKEGCPEALTLPLSQPLSVPADRYKEGASSTSTLPKVWLLSGLFSRIYNCFSSSRDRRTPVA